MRAHALARRGNAHLGASAEDGHAVIDSMQAVAREGCHVGLACRSGVGLLV